LTLIFVPFVAAFFISHYCRVIMSTLATRLRHDLGLDTMSLGVLASVYFLVTAVMQAPVGIAIDRYGPRRVLSTLLVVAAAGALLTAAATAFWLQVLARLLIGLGLAACLMSGLKTLSLWFPPAWSAITVGLLVGIGSLGGLAATLPTEWLVQAIGWRAVFVLLAGVCVVVAIGVWVLTPRGGGQARQRRREDHRFAGLLDARFWRLAPVAALTCGSAWALQGLWAAPWLRDVAGFDQTVIATHLLVMSCALAVSAVGSGLIVAGLARIGIPPSGVVPLIVLALVGAEFALAVSAPVSPLLAWATIAGTGSANVVCFVMTARWYPAEVIARINSTLNLCLFTMAFLVQAAFGALLKFANTVAPGRSEADDYGFALLVLAALQLASLLWYLPPFEAREPRDEYAASGSWRWVWIVGLRVATLAALAVVGVFAAGRVGFAHAAG
jgi:predicted MFS family arabinose efflux permease